MNINDEKMIQIQNKINGKASLENELKDLQNNKIKLGNDLIELENKLDKQQLKVKQTGLLNFFYLLIEKRRKKLNNARKKENDSYQKFKDVESEIDKTQERIKVIKNELDLIHLYDKQLDEIIKEKIQKIKNNALPQVQEILIKEEKIDKLQESILYNMESLDLVKSALDTIKDIMPRLQSIKELSMYDTISDIRKTSIDKYTLLDKLQPYMVKLQDKLDMLKQRVNDCKYIENVKVEISPVLRAKDMSYKLNVYDVEALSKINASYNRVYLAEQKLNDIGEKISKTIEKVQQERIIEREKIVNIIKDIEV